MEQRGIDLAVIVKQRLGELEFDKIALRGQLDEAVQNNQSLINKVKELQEELEVLRRKEQVPTEVEAEVIDVEEAN